jgi:hypothetical protein
MTICQHSSDLFLVFFISKALFFGIILSIIAAKLLPVWSAAFPELQ